MIKLVTMVDIMKVTSTLYRKYDRSLTSVMGERGGCSGAKGLEK